MADQPAQSAQGVYSCGYSYAIGQARLHADDAPGGDYSQAYKDPAFLSSMMFGLSGSTADLQNQLVGNGPIPGDVPETPAQLKSWDPKDGVVTERHVYFYGFAPRAVGQGHDATDLQLCLQVAGLAQNRNPPMWVLPTSAQFGVPIPYFTLSHGSTLAEGRWDDNAAVWILHSPGTAASIKQITNLVISIIGSAFNAGGIVGALEVGSERLIASLPEMANAITTGDASNLFPSLAEIVEGVAQGVLHDANAVGAISNAIRSAGSAGSDLMTFIDTSGKTITNITSKAEASVSSVVGQAQVYANQLLSQAKNGIPGSAAQVLDTVVRQRGGVGTGDLILMVNAIKGGSGLLPKDFPTSFSDVDSLVGKQAQAIARKVLEAGGDYFQTANPATHFFDMAVAAANPGELVGLMSNVPWYAQQYFLTGASLRAAELQAGDFPSVRSYYATQVPRPGGGLPGSTFMTKAQKVIAFSTQAALGLRRERRR